LATIASCRSTWVAATSRKSTGIACRPEAHDGALLQDAQEVSLEFERQVADLVEKQQAAVRRLDLADLALGGAGKRALLVSEQLGLDQVGRDGGAVDDDEGPLRS